MRPLPLLRHLRLPLASLLAAPLITALACGARPELLPADLAGQGGAEPTGPTTGPGPTTSTATGTPTAPCLPAPRACEGGLNFNPYYINDWIGMPTVVLEVEALDTGDVIAAGYFGALRLPAGSTGFMPELLNAPVLLTSSFLQLRRGAGAELWAAAFGEVVYSPDAGSTWYDAPDLAGVELLHRTPDGRLFGVGDAAIGEISPPLGPVGLEYIPALDGDTPTYSENNVVFGFAEANGTLIASERFGRVARAPASGGPFQGDGQQRLGGEAELLHLGDGRVVSFSTGGEVQIACGPTDEFVVIGQAKPYPAVASNATQLVRAPDGVLWAASSDGLQRSCDDGQTWEDLADPDLSPVYDLSVGPDGFLWYVFPSGIVRLELPI